MRLALLIFLIALPIIEIGLLIKLGTVIGVWLTFALVIGTAILGGALITLAPFYFMFVFATHPRTEIFQLPPPLFFGAGFADNVAILLSRIPFWSNVGWSLYIAVMSTALTLLFCSMGGYAFAMYEFRFKNLLLLALVMGYRSIEEGRSQLAVELRAEAGRAADAIAIPSFFAWVDDRKTPLPISRSTTRCWPGSRST